MKFTRPLAAVLVAAMLFTLPMAALADGPAWWDPFNLAGTAKPSPAAARKPAAKESSWMKLPGFGAKQSTASRKTAVKKSNEPSTLAKMGNSTKKFFSGAKDALTFGGDKKPASTRPTGYGASGGEKRIAREEKKEPSGNILTSWWPKKEEPKPRRPKTVPDFIAGERP